VEVSAWPAHRFPAMFRPLMIRASGARLCIPCPGSCLIGNRRHRVPDPVFQDALMRPRTGNGPANMATPRHMAMTLIRNAGGKHSLNVRRKAAIRGS
jgi:hypothetical protein